MEREYKIIRSLNDTDVPVPDALCLCEDSDVIGTPFYIMSFLDGRHFTDPAMPGVSGEERKALYVQVSFHGRMNIRLEEKMKGRAKGKDTVLINVKYRWKSAIETLAKFHRVVPKSVGLENFGKPTGFYDRQIATFTTISRAQAQVRDVDSKEPVGELPHFEDMSRFFSEKATQPRDRGTLVHGDYKIDNLIFHKTEARVIGILDWEMATVGHPLSDFCNVTSPYILEGADSSTESFQPGRTPGLPSREECMRWYHEVSGYDPAGDIAWGDAFFTFRGSVIMQGIAARFAARQASSARASDYGKRAKPFAMSAWERVQEVQRIKQKGKL